MPGDRPIPSERSALASALRDICIDRLRHDYEQAAIQGLCGEGAFEYALDQLRHLPVTDLLAALPPNQNPPLDEGADL